MKILHLGCRPRPSQATALALALLALAAPVRARAADPSPPDLEARQLYEQGLESYRRGDYDEAIDRLKASYLRLPAPGLLYDLAQAHRLKGNCAQALELYRQYLSGPGNDPVRALAEERASEMEACVAGAAPRVANRPTISAVAPASSTTAAIPPAATLVATGVATPPTSPTHPTHGRRAAWTWTIASAALAGTTGYLAWRTVDSSNQVSGMYLPGTSWSGAGMDAEQSGHLTEKLEIVTGVGTLLAAGIATWLWRRAH